MKKKVDEELLRVREGLERYLSGNEMMIEVKLDMIAELKDMMQDEVVHFVFTKVDGTERHAYGTRASDILGQHELHGLKCQEKDHSRSTFGTFSYFDIEREDWRSFRVDRLLEIRNDYTI